MNKVVEVAGHDGTPQPSTWRILLDDQSARGGLREIEVSKGHVVSEHTPMRHYVGANVVMNFQRLNLDSPGVFTVANQEAVKAGIGFERVDYTLRADDETGAPVWLVNLKDANGRILKTVRISADNGTVLHHETTTRRTVIEDEPSGAYAPPPPPTEVDNGGDDPDRDNVGHKIDKVLHRAGANVEQFFTGHRTFDRRFRDEP